MASAVDFQLLFFVWIVSLALLFGTLRRNQAATIGLPLAFFFATAFEYVGSFAYAVPGYSHVRIDGSLYLLHKDFTAEQVYAGLQLTTIGLVAFVAGVATLCRNGPPRGVPVTVPRNADRTPMLALAALTAAGFATMFVRLPIPMIDAFAQVGRNAGIVLVSLGAALALSRGATRAVLTWLLAGSLIPALYLVGWGFMSYGFLAFTFFAGFFALRLAKVPPTLPRFMLLTLVSGYGLLSVFVAYMSYRFELRSVLWSNAGLADRIEAVLTAFRGITILNPFDFTSLDWLTTRLNQSMFIGKMIDYHAVVGTLRLYGESLALALIAPVPRALWPGKPEMGGSAFMSEHTGLTFAQGVSFGTGPVFEFYVNFGTAGVVTGFFALGLTVAWIDRKAGSALGLGQLLTFAKWATVGLALVRPLSDMFFLVNTTVASFLVFWALAKVFPERALGPPRGPRARVHVGERRGAQWSGRRGPSPASPGTAQPVPLASRGRARDGA